MESTKKPVAIIYKEGLAQSIASDVATFGFLGLCIWASQGSTFWTLTTGILFLFFLVSSAGEFFSGGAVLKFYSLDDLQAWVTEQQGIATDQRQHPTPLPDEAMAGEQEID